MINLTDGILLCAVILFFVYGFYDQFVMNRWKGKTQLKVRLQNRGRLDAVIFIALIGLLVYQSGITPITLYLLIILAILCGYTAFLRNPVLLLKENGFFYANFYLPYERIAAINLSEDGVLVIDLHNRKRLLIYVVDVDDLPKILQFFIDSGRVQRPASM
ncbi:DUF986 family protein [Testudinibacter sp. TR-2022]|uniref:DUF986 family protein n=1 Tax=Testudinibacter sp. TR-2022 TaxID=2585029 RepID=UPI0022799177|nr:DUF986 family protein [Testudinibacter sp. TR-2022]